MNTDCAATGSALKIVRTLRAGQHFTVYRGLRDDGVPVLIVTTQKAGPVSPGGHEPLDHEYSLAADLDRGWAARPLALTCDGARTLLVLEDPGGEPLTQCLLEPPPAIGRFLQIGIGIADALRHVHQAGLIHRDIRPANVLFDPATGKIRLLGFGFATRIAPETTAPAAAPAEAISTSFPYMAPEQTGRMSRSIDTRSDLYGLGVTLYEVLTGKLPFVAADALEWTHCHLARRPTPALEYRADVPGCVARIVMKLLEKAPEQRYQTAAGVIHDLRRCLQEWDATGRISDFSLGTRDIPVTLQIAAHLYGRERELGVLHSVLERVATTGVCECVLISGPAGIGKSCLVQDLHSSIARNHGLFAWGKCEQYTHNIPYAPLAQALLGLTTTLLEQPPAQRSTWQKELAAAAGPHGRLLFNLVPQLELLIGQQSTPADLAPHEALTQLQTALRRVLAVFARSEHPLVLFLDDLQWVDAATAGVIEDLASEKELRHLLLIYAFREDDSGATAALKTVLPVLRGSERRFVEIALKPLGVAAVSRMVCETLACDARHGQSLAELVREKAGGNPFFTIQFLASLWQDGLLKLDDRQDQWTWSLERIRDKGHTDNVLQLMAANLVRLPPAPREALQQLACLGGAVHVTTLSYLAAGGGSLEGPVLEQAVRAGYLVRLESGYRFSHDRVHESAYSLIPPERRPQCHLEIGRRLASGTPRDSLEREIFTIVTQFNRGLDRVTDPVEREQIARYNLTAGLRAKDTTGYAAALEYFHAGRELLGADCWNTQYELAFGIEFHTAQCEYLTGALEAALQRLERLAGRARTLDDQCTVACLRTDILATANQGERAIEIGLDFLRGLGMDWPPHPDRSLVDEEVEKIWSQLGNRAIEDLVHLPLMTDARAMTAMSVLSQLSSIAGYTDPDLQCLLSGRMVNLSLTHGNSAAASVGYCMFAVILATRYQDFPGAFRFGRLGIELVKARGFERIRIFVYFIYGAAISPWIEPIQASVPWLRESVERASRHGDLNTAIYSGHQLITARMLLGDRLAEVEQEVGTVLESARRGQVRTMVGILGARRGQIRSLRGLTSGLGCFDHLGFDERAYEEQLGGDSRLTSAGCWYWTYRLQAHYLQGDYPCALAAGARAQALLWASWSLPNIVEYHFYSALAHGALHPDAAPDQQPLHEEALLRHQQHLVTWTRHCPDNFRSRELLIEAECARLRGGDGEALRLYDAAAATAHAGGFVHIEALAHEVAGRFCVRRGLETAGCAHLQRARDAYLRWGAEAKVRELEHLRPALRVTGREVASAALEHFPVQQLDVMSVVRTFHTLASATTLQDLIGNLMRTVLENAGADRGLLIRVQGDAARVEAEAMIRAERVEVRLCDAPIAAANCPENLLRHVMHTRGRVVIADATESEPLYGDSYQRRPKSIICVPILRQGRLSGLLYLENNLTSHAFTADRAALLEVIAGQAANCLENTRLYTELQEREIRIRRLVDSNIIGVMFWDFEGRITDANDAFLALVGYSREDLAAGAIDWKKLTPLEYHKSDASALEELRQTGTHATLEKEYVRKDGGRIPVLVGGAFLHGSHEVGVSFVLDLSERRGAEAERQAHQVAAAASRAKSRFLATMSHELRTPLNGLLGYAQILERDRSLNPRQQAAIEVMHRCGRQLLALITDILDLAKIEAGRFGLTPVEICLPEFLRSVADVVKANAAQRGLKLVCDWDEGLPELIRADEGCLRRVLLNLLSNAVKFTEQGEVAFEVRLEPPTRLRFRVHDTGIGIRQDMLQGIFQPFSQFGEAHQQAAGTGLGLAISRELVRQMGGELRVESTFGTGSTFWFELDAVPLPTTEAAVASEQRVVCGYQGRRRTILLVDDDADSRGMLIQWLHPLGFDTLEAGTGEVALEQVGRRPDLIIMDLVMPGAGGLQAIRALRDQPGTRTLPIIATSASVSKGDAHKSRMAGADAFLAKPVDLVELQALLGSLLSLEWQFAAVDPGSGASGAS